MEAIIEQGNYTLNLQDTDLTTLRRGSIEANLVQDSNGADLDRKVSLQTGEDRDFIHGRGRTKITLGPKDYARLEQDRRFRFEYSTETQGTGYVEVIKGVWGNI